MSLLRRAVARPMVQASAMRGLNHIPISFRGPPAHHHAAYDGPIKPIDDFFPYTPTVGAHGWFNGPYSLLSAMGISKRGPKGAKGPVGHMFRPPYIVGGVHNPVIDPEKHFNNQDRFKTVGWGKLFWIYLHNLYTAKCLIFAVHLPVIAIMCVVCLEQRREPMEIFMDREEYWKDFDSYHYGVYFDHHHFSHMLCHRRAKKWGYDDVTLAHGGHH